MQTTPHPVHCSGCDPLATDVEPVAGCRATFEVGATYTARSACDHNAVWTFRVLNRTAKFVTVCRGNDSTDVMRVGVKVDEQGEWALPFGSYSMAPVIRANR